MGNGINAVACLIGVHFNGLSRRVLTTIKKRKFAYTSELIVITNKQIMV